VRVIASRGVVKVTHEIVFLPEVVAYVVKIVPVADWYPPISGVGASWLVDCASVVVVADLLGRVPQVERQNITLHYVADVQGKPEARPRRDCVSVDVVAGVVGISLTRAADPRLITPAVSAWGRRVRVTLPAEQNPVVVVSVRLAREVVVAGDPLEELRAGNR